MQHEVNSPGSLRGLCPVAVETLMEDDIFACLSGCCVNIPEQNQQPRRQSADQAAGLVGRSLTERSSQI